MWLDCWDLWRSHSRHMVFLVTLMLYILRIIRCNSTTVLRRKNATVVHVSRAVGGDDRILGLEPKGCWKDTL